jgi:hypothetical protein
MKKVDHAPMITWIWRQIGIDLPADWECLQYSVNREAGRCAFADRYRFRLELNWRTFASPPDFDRMLKDYAGSLEATWGDVCSVRCRGWPGLVGQRPGEAVSRFGAYLEELGIVVELVFIHPEQRDDALEARILNTVREVMPDAAGFQRWRAFGMDLRVPRAFTLKECAVRPLLTGLRFEGPKKPDGWVFRRYGMVDRWLQLSLRDWLAAQTGDSLKEGRPETLTRRNEHVERLTGAWRPRGLLHKRGVFAAAAWRNEQDRRLYHVMCITGKKRIAWHPAAGAESLLQAAPEFLTVPTAP